MQFILMIPTEVNVFIGIFSGFISLKTEQMKGLRVQASIIDSTLQWLTSPNYLTGNCLNWPPVCRRKQSDAPVENETIISKYALIYEVQPQRSYFYNRSEWIDFSDSERSHVRHVYVHVSECNRSN